MGNVALAEAGAAARVGADSPSGPGLRRGDALHQAAKRFAAASDTPRLDAELLLAHALGITREDLLLGRGDDAIPPAFATLTDRRAAGEPIAYLTGRRAFWTIELEVGPGALIPRPDSETLIEAALTHFGEAGPARILDLGTGPGTLLLAALDQWPRASGLGIDRWTDALAFARRNAERLGLLSRAQFREGDWATDIDERFDLILCNPPYVRDGDADASTRFEPAAALFAGPDGLAAYRDLAPQFARLLAAGGLVALEIGHDQRDAVSAFFAEIWMIGCRRDLGGRDRAFLLTRAHEHSLLASRAAVAT